jgi:hydrogenase maturation protein HypF
VVLSGGVFQNRLLLEATAALLERAGLRVLVPALLPPNDGGISFGQAAIAAARLAA